MISRNFRFCYIAILLINDIPGDYLTWAEAFDSILQYFFVWWPQSLARCSLIGWHMGVHPQTCWLVIKQDADWLLWGTSQTWRHPPFSTTTSFQFSNRPWTTTVRLDALETFYTFFGVRLEAALLWPKEKEANNTPTPVCWINRAARMISSSRGRWVHSSVFYLKKKWWFSVSFLSKSHEKRG